MIANLRGTLIEKSAEQFIVDVAGVGYEVFVSGALAQSAPAQGEQLSVIIHTDVKETSIVLFGFASVLEKQVFLMLKKVKGVGSRLAMNILAAVPAERLLAAIGRSDVGALVKVPGIGKKTAERLVVELRENVAQLAYQVDAGSVLDLTETGSRGGGGLGMEKFSSNAEGDAVLALEKLGFVPEMARNAVREAKEVLGLGDGAGADAGELLKTALARL